MISTRLARLGGLVRTPRTVASLNAEVVILQVQALLSLQPLVSSIGVSG